jgi:hypothetical protein
MRLEFPFHLTPSLIAHTYAVVAQAAIESAGGKKAHFEVSSSGSTFCEYSGMWQ